MENVTAHEAYHAKEALLRIRLPLEERQKTAAEVKPIIELNPEFVKLKAEGLTDNQILLLKHQNPTAEYTVNNTHPDLGASIQFPYAASSTVSIIGYNKSKKKHHN